MPMFKKSGGKIFAVQFNKAEERALDQEIKKQIVENDRAFDMDKESSILWMLHTQCPSAFYGPTTHHRLVPSGNVPVASRFRHRTASTPASGA